MSYVNILNYRQEVIWPYFTMFNIYPFQGIFQYNRAKLSGTEILQASPELPNCSSCCRYNNYIIHFFTRFLYITLKLLIRHPHRARLHLQRLPRLKQDTNMHTQHPLLHQACAMEFFLSSFQGSFQVHLRSSESQ